MRRRRKATKPKKQFNMMIDEELFLKARMVAMMEKKTMTRVVTQYLKLYAKRLDKTAGKITTKQS